VFVKGGFGFFEDPPQADQNHSPKAQDFRSQSLARAEKVRRQSRIWFTNALRPPERNSATAARRQTRSTFAESARGRLRLGNPHFFVRSRLLWRKRSDDCFKARIAPQRIPKRIETRIAVADNATGQLRCYRQSFDCAILVARPRINDSQVLD
jgi:hypothetical protein